MDTFDFSPQFSSVITSSIKQTQEAGGLNQQEMKGSWVSAAIEPQEHFFMHCVYPPRLHGRFRTASIQGLPWAPDFLCFSHEMNVQLNKPSEWGRFTASFALTIFSSDTLMMLMSLTGLWRTLALERENQLASCFQTDGLRSYSSADIMDNRGGSSEQEKKEKPHIRDCHPPLLLHYLLSHMYVCSAGHRAQRRSILNLEEHSAIFKRTNFIWLSAYHYNNPAPFIFNYSSRGQIPFLMFALFSLLTLRQNVSKRLREYFDLQFKYVTRVRWLFQGKELMKCDSKCLLLILCLQNKKVIKYSALDFTGRPHPGEVFYFSVLKKKAVLWQFLNEIPIRRHDKQMKRHNLSSFSSLDIPTTDPVIHPSI